MRFSIIFVLLSLSLVTFASLPKTASSNPSSTTTAWSSLVQAFDTVQSADSNGASHDSIVTFSAELNTALAYYQNATILAAQNNTAAADNYSRLSINLSGNVTMEAATLDQTARNQLIVRNEIAYGTSFTAALVSAAAVVEADWIRRLLRRRKSVTIESKSR